MKRTPFLISSILFLVLSLPIYLPAKEKIKVVTTLFPTFDFARQIGGDKVTVSLLLPPGVEPHAFEPTPRDIVNINKADLFIYTGNYMEPWVKDILSGITDKNVIVVDVSKGITLLSSDDDDDHEENGHQEGHGHDDNHEETGHHEDHDDHEEPGHHEDHEEESHTHADKDPHIWLDLDNDQVIIESIANALAKKDPVNSSYFMQNKNAYSSKLASLANQFQTALSSCKRRTIVSGGHFAFRYLAKKHQLQQVSVYKGFSPNAEPGAKAVANLIKTIRQTGTKAIYYEELINPRIARMISRETGVQLRMLHGAHNVSKQELEQGVTFLDIMKQNLNELTAGLECQ